ncbi:cytochrome c3 family protein [Thermosulfurimonas sp. F29]|uniref:cytochrome c3 family protein n=1 Tax=Thermosulfurimonas sp. F29 TaxID=2867247 RepID=UPI001C83FF78|nr:cytochrome c3 family protein [Thermosulfurimonas sp. F29]MBX6422053.1 cytochrome c3 family protein [Thermosulfurimonas sp. F29]
MSWWLIVFSLWMVVGSSVSLRAAECVKCHPVEVKVYTHPSYLRGDCAVCHLRVQFQARRVEVPENEVRWWRKLEVVRGEYYLPLPGRMSHRPLVLKAREIGWQKVLDPDLATPIKPGEATFSLKRVYPCDRVQGVTVSVKICLEAGVPFEAEVDCGGGIRGFTTGLATFQAVWVDGLRPGKFRCVVLARSIGGQEVRAEVRGDTGKVESVRFPLASEEEKPEAGIREVMGRRYLYVKTRGRVRFEVGYLPVRVKRRVRRELKDEAHRGLRPPVDTATYACYRCHGKHSLGASHPVDVVYRPGEKVKPDPGLPLFGGRVECASCHEPHTSARPHLLRKQGKDLCLSCHLARYF